MTPNEQPGAKLGSYVKHAFLYPWNLLIFMGGTALAAMSPYPGAFLPIIGGLELAYLTGLSAIPRFRTAVDARSDEQGDTVGWQSTVAGPNSRVAASAGTSALSTPAPALLRDAVHHVRHSRSDR